MMISAVSEVTNKKRFMFAAALFFCAGALYVRTLWADYVWDDMMYLGGFHHYQGLAGVARAVVEPFFLLPMYYRPLVMLTFTVSQEPSVQHAINVVLHALNVVLVFYCALVLMPRDVAESRAGLLAAAFGAFAFAVHPLAVEAVAWVSGRFDTLMCSFVLGTCMTALGGELSRRRLWAVFAFFAAAMFSKEAAIGLPVALPFLLLLKWRLAGIDLSARKQAGQLAALLAVLALAVVLYVAARLVVVQELFAGNYPVAFRSDHILDKLNIAALAVVEFAKLMVNPWSHSALLHPFKYEAGRGLLWQVAVVIIAVIVLFVLAFLKRKPGLNFPLSLLAALAMTWPTLHLISIPNVGNIISDRYALAPLALLLAGLAAVAASWFLRRLPSMNSRERRVPLYVGAVCLLWMLALVAHSHATIPLWRNENSLWAFAYRQVPESDIAHKNYIKSLMIQERWEEADADLKKYFVEHPEAFENMEIADITNWMVIRAKSGDYEGALEVFGLFEREFSEARLAVMNDVRTVGVLYRARGIIEGDAGHWSQALSWHEKAVQVSPTDMRSVFQYAHALFMNGQPEKADEFFSRALAGSTKDVADWAQDWRRNWTLADK